MSRPPFSRLVAAVVGVVVASATLVGTSPPAQSSPPANHTQVVSAVPSALTPAVNDGKVYAITQVGSTMVVGGDFTSVTANGGASQTRRYLFAFDATSGALRAFAPTLNGDINALVPGPTPDTVYVGGSFTTVNGANHSHVALLSLSTGAPVAGFRAGATNGVVNELVLSGGRLFVGGNFTTAGGVQHQGLAALNGTTGTVDPYMGVDVTERHNDSGSGAQGAIGVRDLDVTEDGTRLVAIGNFKKADGLDRDQMVMISLGATSAIVTADWQTNRYKPYCFNFAFDSYMRGVSFSPDGSYLVAASTGGHVGGTLCDTASRFETFASGQDLQPTWVADSGGDTLWGVTVTETAVYVGGHQRWMNNSLAGDYAGPGAVPRAGIAALSTETGVPLKWNPGRNPRGTAVYALYATSQGLWMGSNTDYVGNYAYRRPKLVLFPLANGAAEASDATANLPGTAYVGGGAAGNTNVLYRVNAGGTTIGSADSGPDWAGDAAGDSPYRNSGSNAAGYSSGAGTDATVPSSTPNAVFDTERWSPSDDPAMEWNFPAASGLPLQVRLYFSNRCTCTSSAGSRAFDVRLDGSTVLDDFDIVSQAGDQNGTMRAFDITSDGNVDIDFRHVVENPLVNAIEIVRTDVPPPGPTSSSLKTIQLTAAGAQPASAVNAGGIDWTTMRGAFLAGGSLFYGKNDGTFNRRTFSAGSFGPEQLVDPYHDPAWVNVTTGSGGTFDGNRPALYGQMSGVRGMAYADGRLYYTMTGSSDLFWRFFNVDSAIMGPDVFTANGGRSWGDTGGMFAASGKLYFVSPSNGNLNSMSLTGAGPVGATSVVDGPALGGNSWAGRAVFLAASNAAPPNQAPNAVLSRSCTDLICQFDAAGSTDADGTIEEYAWSFGDGATATGQNVSHVYDEPGSYTVSLVVTDDDDATDSTSTTVSVTQTPPAGAVSHVNSSTGLATSATPSVTVPTGVQVGDQLLLTAAIQNEVDGTAPAGWTVIGSDGSSALTTKVWTKRATAGDLSGSVAVTLPTSRRTALTLSAYRGVDVTSPIQSIASATSQNTSSHTTPAVVAGVGAWVVSIWSDKSAATSAWTVPGTITQRASVIAGGSGRVSTVVGDVGGPQAGAVAGVTATTDAVSARSVTWSVVLDPQ